jgi:mercuric ion transport protein
VTTLLLGYGFYAVCWRPAKAKAACAAGAACKGCRSNPHAAVALWLGTVLLLGGIAFVFIEPLLANE